MFRCRRQEAGERLLIRGGTTSVGLAAAAIAKRHVAVVVSTTRRTDREALLHRSGAYQLMVDDGHLAARIGSVVPGGVEKVLELVGVTTLGDSLRRAGRHGVHDRAGRQQADVRAVQPNG